MNTSSELPEFLASVSRATDVDAALRNGVVRIAEAFDAEVAAIVRQGQILASVGYARGDGHEKELLPVVDEHRVRVKVTGLGWAHSIAVEIEQEDAVIVLARTSEPFERSEVADLKGMGRVLTLTLRLLDTVERERALRVLIERQMAENQGLLDDVRSHQSMLEANLRIQRLISQRGPVDVILQAISDEARDLLRADLVAVLVNAPDGVDRAARSVGSSAALQLGECLDDETLAALGGRPSGLPVDSASGPGEGTPGHHTVELAGADGARARVASVTSVPVLIEGIVTGGFYVVSLVGPDGFDPVDIGAVHTFASQAGLALTDASTVDELHHAFHDTLTGLPNRALFLDRLEHALTLANRRRTTTALLFLDLDDFKLVNDRLGHAAGDELLRQVGGCLAEVGRASDSAARIGGDEFAVVLEDTTGAEASRVADRLAEQVAAIDGPEGTVDRPSVSIGIATTGPDCATGDELLRRADIAMYSVKTGKGGGAALYDPAMGATRLDMRSFAAALERALDAGHFVVHYQPVLSLQTRVITGAEALVRWLDPERGLIPPDQFINVAEDTGMIVPIGRHVLREACARAAYWRRTFPRAADLSVNVNLSPRQLEHPGILFEVQSALEDAELDPSALVLEVTESLFVEDLESNSDRLSALKALGVRLAIDDFGTGFSSLGYVQKYPFDVLKIDRSFVRGLGTPANSGAVVKTMLALGQQLGMATVAEGIESPVELAQLRALRCTHGQGYLFAKPVDGARLERLLVEGIRAPVTAAR